MADVPNPDSSATGSPKADSAETVTAPNETGKSGNSEQELQALRKRVGDMSGLFEGLKKQIAGLQQQVQTAKPKEEPNVLAEIEQQRAELRAFKEAAIAEKRESAIQAAIASHGIDADNADYLYDHIIVRHASKVKVEGNKVFVEDPVTGEQQTVKDFVGGLLKGPRGDKFKPAPAVTQTPARSVRTSTTGGAARVPYAELPKEERLKMSEEERRAYVREDLRLGGR